MQQLGGRFNNVPTSLEDMCKNDGRDNFDLVRVFPLFNNIKKSKTKCGNIW
jgi:hypothetical protein